MASTSEGNRVPSLSALGHTALELIERPIQQARSAVRAEAAKAESRLRAALSGNDDSQSLARQLASLKRKEQELFAALDPEGRGFVPIDVLEDLFGAAGLLEARTEAGQLAFDADIDGNGALDAAEFANVMAQLRERRGRIDADQPAGTHTSFVFGTEGAHETMREVVFHTLENPAYSDFARLISIVDIIATAAAILILLLQSDATLYNDAPGFAVVEGLAVAFFSAVLIGRLLTCPSKIAFLKSPWNWIDFLTIVPFFAVSGRAAPCSQSGYF
jgi:hypothetical protein